MKNHKKRHISKTTRNWTVIFGGKICNTPKERNHRVENFKLWKIINLGFLKILKKSQKTSHLEKHKDLRSHNWRQDSQSLIVHCHNPTTGLGISNLTKKIDISFVNIFWKNHKKRHISKNKELGSHIWRQDSESLRVLWQNPNTGLGISAFAKKKLI